MNYKQLIISLCILISAPILLNASQDLSHTSEKTELKLTPLKEADAIIYHCTQVFEHRNKSFIKPLIKLIQNCPSKNINSIYLSIMEWAFQNDYGNLHSFIKAIPRRRMRDMSLEKFPLYFHIFKSAIIYHHNEIVTFLLKKRMSFKLLVEKDIQGNNCIDYAIKSDNQIAKDMLLEYIAIKGQKEMYKHYFFMGSIGTSLLLAVCPPLTFLGYFCVYSLTSYILFGC